MCSSETFGDFNGLYGSAAVRTSNPAYNICFETQRGKKDLDQGSRGDLKPGLTVLARTSSN
jgi:hypothetical protein